MTRRSPLAGQCLAVVLLLGVTGLAAGCGGGGQPQYPDVSVSTPDVRESGPTLTMAQWRRRVSAICRRAAIKVTRASSRLASEVTSASDVGEVSRRAFEVGKPVLEQQLRALAHLRPPPAVASDYQTFVGTLADELRWSGRIALMMDRNGSSEELGAADHQLASAASEARSFVSAHRLTGCRSPSGAGG